MTGRAAAVLDVGKTHAKLTLWSEEGAALARRTHANARIAGARYAELDVDGIEAWMGQVLAEFQALAPIGAIIPVAHGAAAALIRDGALYAPPMDYEDQPTAAERSVYDAGRDAFADTGSPALPAGLNLGMQFHRLEAMTGAWPGGVSILTWAQYWAWRLCGIASTEIASLGCHTDLWRPIEGRPTDMAIRRGWAERLAPLRRASDVLGPVAPEWRTRAGLAEDCAVLCGLHDSNVGLWGALGHPELAGADVTVLSTGTWFVAMRAQAAGAKPVALREDRDTLLNVDVQGRPVPSARFMGGREAEILLQGLERGKGDSANLTERLEALVSSGAMILPTATPGVGPFPHGIVRWASPPDDPGARALLVSLYLALMADATLDLLGSRDRLVVEGRFAADLGFVQALAALRPGQAVYTSAGHDDVGYGALRLLDPTLQPPARLAPVAPLALKLDGYRRLWRSDGEIRA